MNWKVIGIVILLLVVVVGGLIAYNAFFGTSGQQVSGTKYQIITIPDRGSKTQIMVSADHLDNLEKVVVPTDQPSGDASAQTISTPWVIENPDNVQCFTLDPTKGLPTGVMDCRTGVQVAPGTVFSYVGKPDSGFKLHR